MQVFETALAGLCLIEPKVHGDRRGYFLETYQASRYRQAGMETTFVQDNLSLSVRGTLRGLHFQLDHPQAKLVQVLRGEVFDVAVDLRTGSPTFGRWAGFHLDEVNHRQLFIPAGFAHGFVVLSEQALFYYKCSDIYRPEDEGGVLWNDPEIGIHWPLESPRLSDKDANLPRLGAILPGGLPRMDGAQR